MLTLAAQTKTRMIQRLAWPLWKDDNKFAKDSIKKKKKKKKKDEWYTHIYLRHE